MATNLEMPKTNTPAGVFVTLGLLIILIGWFLYAFLGFGFLGIILLFVILGLTTKLYTDTVPGFHARIMLNQLKRKQRVLFQGLNLKVPWESQTQELDLRVDLKEVLTETYASEDALMEVKYVYTMRPNFGDNAGENIIRYASFEPAAIQQDGRALFSMLLSDHYASKPGEDLLNKAEINKAVFDSNSEIAEFEKEHGVVITVRLEDSDFNKDSQKFRNMMSGAKSLDDAIKTLIEGGRTPEEAEKIAKLMNFDNVQENIITLKAEGLENLHDVTILPPVGLGGKGGKK